LHMIHENFIHWNQVKLFILSGNFFCLKVCFTLRIVWSRLILNWSWSTH